MAQPLAYFSIASRFDLPTARLAKPHSPQSLVAMVYGAVTNIRSLAGRRSLLKPGFRWDSPNKSRVCENRLTT